MHESRLVTDLIREAVRVANLNRAEDIPEVLIDIGALSHVTPESLESHLIEAAVGTVVEETAFTITKSADTSAADALDIRLVSMKIGDG
jgi:hydrogenase nickel incorporation protein HypA/HybF